MTKSAGRPQKNGKAALLLLMLQQGKTFKNQKQRDFPSATKK
ncbi:hypothetical protein [Klebsiella pneumoniae]|nr:hypothetical protein [Klebsiella pneumoniae]